MRILYLRSSSMQCDPHADSILDLDFDPTRVIEVRDYFTEDSNERIIRTAQEFKPTHVIWLGTCGGPYETKKETFEELRKTAKVICLIPEASHPDWKRLIDDIAPHVDLIVNLDGDDNWEGHSKGHTTLAIYDTKAYRTAGHHPWELRPIPAGFCGGSGSPGTMRERITTYLRTCRGHNNMGLLTEFSFIENPGTYQLYADFLMMSKIVVNPAGSGEDRSLHVKGRVLEAGLAGCCLLEQGGSPIHKWFSSESFFYYSDPFECEAQIKYLLENPQVAKASAESLSKEVREKYSPCKLWAEIFEKVKTVGSTIVPPNR